MSDTIQSMLDNRPLDEVMRLTIEVDELKLKALVKNLSDHEVITVSSFIFKEACRQGAGAVLRRGFIFYTAKLVGEEHGNLEFLYGLMKEVGISRTPMYREIQVYRRFGDRLLTHPQLAEFFVPEALKILAQDSTPEAAREEAIELAKKGEGIDIRRAKQLIRHQRKLSSGRMLGEDAPATTSIDKAATPRRRPVTQAKTLVKKIVGLISRKQKRLLPKEIDAIVLELERAIATIRETASRELPQPAGHEN